MEPALLKNTFVLFTHSGDFHFESKMNNAYSTDMKTSNHFVSVIYQSKWTAFNFTKGFSGTFGPIITFPSIQQYNIVYVFMPMDSIYIFRGSLMDPGGVFTYQKLFIRSHGNVTVNHLSDKTRKSLNDTSPKRLTLLLSMWVMHLPINGHASCQSPAKAELEIIICVCVCEGHDLKKKDRYTFFMIIVFSENTSAHKVNSMKYEVFIAYYHCKVIQW